jgi:hypothetical protein
MESFDDSGEDYEFDKKNERARMVLVQDEADGVSMMVVSKSNPSEGETFANWFGNLLIIMNKGEGLRKRYNNHFFSSLIEIDFGWPMI